MKLEVLCTSIEAVEQPRNHTKYRKNFPIIFSHQEGLHGNFTLSIGH